MQIVFWTVFGYLLGSIPFAYLLGKFIVQTDIRAVGDGNPGGTNVWIAGGWKAGLTAALLDIFKGFIPVHLALQAGLSGGALLPVSIAPILGHATQPFLGWRGGKALGATGGVWLAHVGPIVFPVYAMLTLPVLALQEEHAYAALSGMFALIAYTVLADMPSWLITFALLNTTLLFWTHRREMGRPLRWRKWVFDVFLRRGV